MSNFECSCGNDTFNITTRSMVGDDETYIDRLVCTVCGDEYRDAPSPTRIRLPDE